MTTTLITADGVWGHPDASGVLVRDGRILRVVARADAAPEHDSRLRLDGTILPGFVDAHSHPLMGAELSRGVDLTGVRDLEELRSELLRARAGLQPDEWLFGWGLEHSLWGGADPSSEAFEAVTGATPTALRMFDAHSMVANRAALGAAGIAGERSFPTGSRVVVDGAGEPTGLLLEMEAMGLLLDSQPVEAADAVLARLRDVLDRMAASGLTGTHVMDANGDALARYAELESRGALPVRLKVHPWVTPGTGPSEWVELAELIGRGGERWRVHGVKLFVDGTIDNGTAWLRAPDRDGASRSSAWADPAAYTRAIEFFAERGIGTATHAIGDAGVLHAADAIAAARSRFPGARHRIEHLELTGDDVIERVRRSGAVASMQPTHCTHFVHADGSDNWSARIGDRRAHAWRVESMRAAGIRVALGSDWPIAELLPLPIVGASALRRPVASDKQPVLPQEGIAVEHAVDGYTVGAAYASGDEAEEGRLAPGFRADLTVLGVDPDERDPEVFGRAAVEATFVDGERVGAKVDAS